MKNIHPKNSEFNFYTLDLTILLKYSYEPNMNILKEAYKVSSHDKSNVFGLGSRSLHSWTMGRMLRANPHNKLRQEFLDSPYLYQITFGDLFADPFAMEDFLQNCRRLPHCGEISIRRIREVIKLAADGKFHLTQTVIKRD